MKIEDYKHVKIKPGFHLRNLIHNLLHYCALALTNTNTKLCIMTAMVELLCNYVANYAASTANGNRA